MIKLYKKYEEIINYVIVGGLTTFVSLFSYFVCVHTFLNPTNPLQLQIANTISWICAVTFAYITNRVFVFKSENKNRLIELVLFYGSRITTLLVDMVIMFVLVTILKINDTIAKLMVQIIVMILNYIFSKMLVFRKR